MDDNIKMICDMETGICGPAGTTSENINLEMIDLTDSRDEEDEN